MLSTKEREELAEQLEPRYPDSKQPLKINLPKGSGWLALAALTPLSIPFLVLGKELIKPFKKQRY